MNFKNIASDFNLESKDSLYLIFILLFAFAIAVYKIKFYNVIGFNSDTPFFLSNALYYAGMNPNSILSVQGVYNSPTLCFLTAILFKLGFVTPMSLYVVASVFEILGAVGLYIFLKHRFSPLLSVLGVIFYESTYLFLTVNSSGLADSPAVAVSIWILIFAMISIDKNPRYFIPTAILFVIGMYTRATVGFVLPVIFLYYFTRHDVLKAFDDLITNTPEFKKKFIKYLKSREFKYIAVSVVLGIVLYYIVIWYHQSTFDIAFNYLSRASSSAGGFKAGQGKDIGYKPNPFYYINHFMSYIAYYKLSFHGIKFSSCIVGTIVLCLLVKAVNHLGNIDYYMKLRINDYYNLPKFSFVLILLAAVSLIVAVWGFKINHFITSIALSVFFTIFICMLHKYNIDSKNTSFSLINLYWMLIYLAFISFISIKVHRYFLPIFVPVAYFGVLAIESILDFACELRDSEEFRQKVFKIVPIVLIALLMLSAAFSLDHMDENKMNKKYAKIYKDANNTTGYLKEVDEDYMDKDISTDHRSRFYNWFLEKNTSMVDNLYEPVSKFDESESDYIFLNESVEFENYTEIYHHGNSYLYNRTANVD